MAKSFSLELKFEEAGARDHVGGVPLYVAPIKQPSPRPCQQALHPTSRRHSRRSDLLNKSKRTARPQNSSHLRQNLSRIGNRAQD